MTEDNKCKECGCNLTSKLRLAAMECPLDKWGAEAYEE